MARSKSRARTAAPAGAPSVSRLDKVKNLVPTSTVGKAAVVGIPATLGLYAYDLAVTNYQMAPWAYVQAMGFAAVEVAVIGGLVYGAAKLAKAAYNNASKENAAAAAVAVKDAALYLPSKGLELAKAGYNMLPSFRRKAAEEAPKKGTGRKAAAAEVEVVEQKRGRSRSRKAK